MDPAQTQRIHELFRLERAVFTQRDGINIQVGGDAVTFSFDPTYWQAWFKPRFGVGGPGVPEAGMDPARIVLEVGTHSPW